MHFDPAKLLPSVFPEYPIFILQTHDRAWLEPRCETAMWRDRKVATANMPGRNDPSLIGQHDADLGRACVGIEDPRNVSHSAVVSLIGIRIQTDFGGIPQVHLAQVVLIDVAQHPHLGEIGDSEKVGTVVQALDPLEA